MHPFSIIEVIKLDEHICWQGSGFELLSALSREHASNTTRQSTCNYVISHFRSRQKVSKKHRIALGKWISGNQQIEPRC
jgi:hypothetical protein